MIIDVIDINIDAMDNAIEIKASFLNCFLFMLFSLKI